MLQQPKVEKKKDTTTVQVAPLIDDKAPRLLFVDSLNAIEIVVSLSSLSKWYESKVESVIEKAAKAKKPETILEHENVAQPERNFLYSKFSLNNIYIFF